VGRLRHHARLGGQRRAYRPRLGLPRFWIQPGLHDPDIVMARFDYAFDPNAARAVESLGGDASNLVALIDANEAAIEAGRRGPAQLHRAR
jgi:hypothetical protein